MDPSHAGAWGGADFACSASWARGQWDGGRATPPAPAEPCAVRLAPTTLRPSLCVTQVLFLLGTLVFAMSLQLDRRAAWNMLGPCLFAIVVMVTMWVSGWGRAVVPPRRRALAIGIHDP